MSFKYFKELKESKTSEEFKEWFDNTASWGLDVYGQQILCAKISNRKAFLRDGTIVEVDNEDKFRMLDSEEERERNKNASCCFCGRTKRRVTKLIAGPNGLFICDKCVGECNRVLEVIINKLK